MATDAQIKSLMGTGPPETLGKMETMRWGVKNPPRDPKIPFSGKTVLVTGSNTGLGLQAAIKYAALGASKVILAVRTPSKGEEAKSKIVAATKRNAADIIVMPLDMSNFSSVRAFAAKLEKEIDRLDIALLNAGVAPPKYALASSGWEMALQVNVLATALLAILLMPKLKATTAKTGHTTQLTLTGSVAHTYIDSKDFTVAPDESILEKMNKPENFSPEKSYSIIKLLTMYIMQGLISDYSKGATGETEVYVNVACPGMCSTDLGRDFPWYLIVPTKLMHLYYARSAEQGSRSLVSATYLGKVGNGEFWTNDIITKQGVLVTSDEGKKLQAKAWKEILDVCKKG